MSRSQPTSDFVRVNGIRLHYLDWGGSGPTLIFLTGMGSSAYIFSRIAPRFTDRFRVLALTRRGHGESDYPDTGYDADTLIEDIRLFMDALHIETAAFAGTYPNKVEKLIYLDALDDRRAESEIIAQNPLRTIHIEREESFPRTVEEYIANLKRDIPRLGEIWSELWDEEISHCVTINESGVVVDKMPEHVERAMVENLIKTYAPKTVQATIPTLNIFAEKHPRLSSRYTKEQKDAFDQFHRDVEQPFFRSLIAEFQSRFPHANIVVIPDGHHYCFIAQEELVHHEMRKFLLA